MAAGILTYSLEGKDEFLYRYIEESMDVAQSELLDSEALRYALDKIEKISEKLIQVGVHNGDMLSGVSASTEGFMFGLGAAWELEPKVKPRHIDEVLESEMVALEGFYENIVANGCTTSVLGQWSNLSEAGLEGVPGMYNLLCAASPELGYIAKSQEADNIVFWGGIGAMVFLRAAEKHLSTTFARQLNLLGKGDVGLDWFVGDSGNSDNS